MTTSTPSLRTLFWILVALLLLPACGAQDGAGTGDGLEGADLDNVDDPGDDDDGTNDPGTSLVGIVLDSMGQPVVDATVTLSSGETVTSGTDGKFRIDELQAASRVLVNVTSPGYARSQTPMEIMQGVENPLVQTLAELDLVETFAAADGAVLSTDAAVSVELPADNFVDADGEAYDGVVTAELTWFELGSPGELGNELDAVPGDFSATRLDGTDVSLESFGMLQVNLFGDEGQDLDLGGAVAPMRLPLVDVGSADQPVAGEYVPAWSYDEELGKWIEEGEGLIVEDADGALFWEFDAPHFSTWNTDVPIQTHGCVSGRLLNSQGTPREGAVARLIGVSYVATTTARTSDDGTFCLEAKNGETAYIEFQYTAGGNLATQRTDPVTIPSGVGTCLGNWSDCVSVGDIYMEFNTCLAGLVVNGDNQPVEGVYVVSPAGGQSVTASDGAFCLAVPVFEQTRAFVLPEPQGTEIYQPVQVFTQAGMPDCQSGCPNLVVLRPYTETGCVAGEAMVDSVPATGLPIEVYDLAFPEVAVSSTLVEQDGGFCAAVPVTPAGVSVSAGSCGSRSLDSNWGGPTCENGNCLDAGLFDCASP